MSRAVPLQRLFQVKGVVSGSALGLRLAWIISPFKWRHFEPTIILLCARWYYKRYLRGRSVMYFRTVVRSTDVTTTACLPMSMDVAAGGSDARNVFR